MQKDCDREQLVLSLYGTIELSFNSYAAAGLVSGVAPRGSGWLRVKKYSSIYGHILLLLRQDHKPEGNTWCIPAGKCEDGEERQTAILRELHQETGLQASPSQLTCVGHIFVRYLTYDFEYYTYSLVLSHLPSVQLSREEHKEFCWVTLEQALTPNLIQDEGSCLKKYLCH